MHDNSRAPCVYTHGQLTAGNHGQGEAVAEALPVFPEILTKERKMKTFKQWCDEHRKALRRGYKGRAVDELEMTFYDWAESFYRLAVLHHYGVET